MLSGEGMQRRKTVKTTIGLISKSNFARAAPFLIVHFCAVVLHDHTFYGGNVVRVLVHIVSLPLIFT